MASSDAPSPPTYEVDISTLYEDVRSGLSGKNKRLSPKYLYDAHGSELFDRITEQPEYYPTRTETEILEDVAGELLEGVSELVELGSGYSRKTQILLDALEEDGGDRYVALDVSQSAIEASAPRLIEDHPKLSIEGCVADFEKNLDIVEHKGRRLVCFLGSTLGNFVPAERVKFLDRVQAMLAPGDELLIGIDLVKDIEVMEAAYDDSAGVSAEFALNLITVLNRELDGDLRIEDFEYCAPYDRDNNWIDMKLRAIRAVDAHFAKIDFDVHFDEGEELRTEVSCKFKRERFERTLVEAGLKLTRWDTDANGWFALALATKVQYRTRFRSKL